MRRIWAASIAVWATLALVAGFAWMRHPAPSTPAPAAVVIQGGAGQGAQAIAAQAGAHATTRTS